MNPLLLFFVITVCSPLVAAEFSLPQEVEISFRRNGQPIPGGNESYGRQELFIHYISQNWRNIVENIECLPPLDGHEDEKGVKFNVSVVRFGYSCAHLPPEEYLEFFEQIVSLYEQKRISFTAFENIYHGADEKHDFWSVNWEHPRVQAIFDRIRNFNPPPDDTFKSMVEDQSIGKLADNYMHDLPVDSPPPETLPGIKLQRPWASLIRKYEAITGKRVPVDPNFPDHNNARPSRKGLQELAAAGPETLIAEPANSWWMRPELLVPSILAALVAVVFWLRRRNEQSV